MKREHYQALRKLETDIIDRERTYNDTILQHGDELKALERKYSNLLSEKEAEIEQLADHNEGLKSAVAELACKYKDALERTNEAGRLLKLSKEQLKLQSDKLEHQVKISGVSSQIELTPRPNLDEVCSSYLDVRRLTYQCSS